MLGERHDTHHAPHDRGLAHQRSGRSIQRVRGRSTRGAAGVSPKSECLRWLKPAFRFAFDVTSDCDRYAGGIPYSSKAIC